MNGPVSCDCCFPFAPFYSSPPLRKEPSISFPTPRGLWEETLIPVFQSNSSIHSSFTCIIPNTEAISFPFSLFFFFFFRSIGKKGIGLGKRATSPNTSERLAKMAKMAEEHEHQTYRDRARLEYEERRAESRLTPAQSTCITLDEKAGKEVCRSLR